MKWVTDESESPVSDKRTNLWNQSKCWCEKEGSITRYHWCPRQAQDKATVQVKSLNSRLHPVNTVFKCNQSEDASWSENIKKVQIFPSAGFI